MWCLHWWGFGRLFFFGSFLAFLYSDQSYQIHPVVVLGCWIWIWPLYHRFTNNYKTVCWLLAFDSRGKLFAPFFSLTWFSAFSFLSIVVPSSWFGHLSPSTYWPCFRLASSLILALSDFTLVLNLPNPFWFFFQRLPTWINQISIAHLDTQFRHSFIYRFVFYL